MFLPYVHRVVLEVSESTAKNAYLAGIKDVWLLENRLRTLSTLVKKYYFI